MSDSYIIEVRSEPAGIVVKDNGRFRFFAASGDFFSLEGRYFRSAREAEQAAKELRANREGDKPPGKKAA